MSSKTVEIPDIGTVKLLKHPAAKSMKISLAPNGEIKVSMPRWVPYNMGIKFVMSKSQWIADNKTEKNVFVDNQVIGKSHVLRLVSDSSVEKVSSRINGSELFIKYPTSMSSESSEVQSKAKTTCVKALRMQAEDVLPDRLRDLAQQYNFSVKSISIRNLKSRWGSCNSKQEITLNLYLMLLPWDLIDYVILHELSHTKAMHHGPDFWKVFQEVLPDAKQRRKAIHEYKPAF